VTESREASGPIHKFQSLTPDRKQQWPDSQTLLLLAVVYRATGSWWVAQCVVYVYLLAQKQRAMTLITGRQNKQHPLDMITSFEQKQFVKDVQYNCDVSDAKDHGIYSMCSMILKLRNLYKWEHQIEPWSEPEPSDLLDWVDEKEKYWQGLSEKSFRPLTILNKEILPHNLDLVNQALNHGNLLYGAGHGRSMKAVFFLADILEKRVVQGCTVYILGTERAKEMASPIALVQDGAVIIKKDSLRYFLWDQFQEMRSSSKSSIQHVLNHYTLLKNGSLDHGALQERLDYIVDEELNLFIYHEVGETLETTFSRDLFQRLIGRFPSSIVELVCRAVKDILADTHPFGLLAYTIRDKKDSSLGLYLGFLDGMREKLFPEIKEYWQYFLDSGDWDYIEQARSTGRDRFLGIAGDLEEIAQMIDKVPDDQVIVEFRSRLLQPLGLESGQG
jgi:hypothetical protein